MRTADELFEEAKRLSGGERKRLRQRLDALEDQPTSRQPAANEGFERDRLAAIDSLLEIAGAAHSDFTDVSKNKGKHLADVYAPRRASK